MCVLSYTNNYIFFHIPKCGGTSLNKVLPNIQEVNSLRDTHVIYTEAKSVFKKIKKETFFKGAIKFTIVRNPYDRTLSLYRYIIQEKNHPLHKAIKKYSFTDFCKFLQEEGHESITSCTNHITDEFGNIPKGIKIFKLEQINNNLNELSSLIGKQLLTFPHINKSYSFYEKTEESQKIIRDVFLEDFNNFYSELI
jgi:hypothetical protein